MLHHTVSGSGESLVLLHGFLENSQMWEAFLPKLNQKYKVICIDLPGHGQSKNFSEIHSMEFMAYAVEQTLDLLEINTATLVGHSMGGYVALAFVELFPDRIKGIKLLNSTPLADSETKKQQRLDALKLAKKDVHNYLRLSIPKLFNPERRNELKKEIDIAKTWAAQTSLLGIKAAQKGMRIRPERLSVLEKVNVKSEILLGSKDELIDYKSLSKILAKTPTKISVCKCGHMAHLEAFKQTLDFCFNRLALT